jgi:hypothetical protein
VAAPECSSGDWLDERPALPLPAVSLAPLLARLSLMRQGPGGAIIHKIIAAIVRVADSAVFPLLTV